MTMTSRADSDSPAERYLRNWHRRHPDASRVFVEARDQAGQSSYERLASLAANSTDVLDVACGTGRLLSMVHDTAPAARLVGIDLSESELRIAAERPAMSRLCIARAQALPLADCSVDLVLCHMALMLFDRPDDVLLEVRRVLRAGGRFSAITNRPAAPDAVAKTILAGLRPAWNRTSDVLHPPPLGDPRTLEAEPLQRLLEAHFDEVVVEPFSILQHVSRRELWPFLVNAVYGLDAIPEADAREALAGIALPEPVPWTTPMVQIQARTS